MSTGSDWNQKTCLVLPQSFRPQKCDENSYNKWAQDSHCSLDCYQNALSREVGCKLLIFPIGQTSLSVNLLGFWSTRHQQGKVLKQIPRPNSFDYWNSQCFLLINTEVLLIRNLIFDQIRRPENLESLKLETFFCENPSPKPVPGSMFIIWRIFRWAPQIMSNLAASQIWAAILQAIDVHDCVWLNSTSTCLLAGGFIRSAKFVSFQTRMAPWQLPLLPQSAWHSGWNYTVVHFLELSWKNSEWESESDV